MKKQNNKSDKGTSLAYDITAIAASLTPIVASTYTSDPVIKTAEILTGVGVYVMMKYKN